ncbi:MAG: hypothetical protein ACLPKB_07150 [Xanthobacteraceae bacterium]
MRISLTGTLRALACIFAPLALPLQSLAQDDSNAANVDATTWAKMYQVMAGTSKTTPSKSLNILTPQGLYVVVDVSFLIGKETPKVASVTGVKVSTDEALFNYFSFLLSQPGVAGLLYSAPWNLLNPNDPTAAVTTVSSAACPPTATTKYNTAAAYVWNSLDDAFCAIDTWNKSNSGKTPKTLQLAVSAGSNSPAWVFEPKYMSSCDFLFMTSSGLTPNASCGYTDIFITPKFPGPFPLPWNPTYKTFWNNFLTALNGYITSSSHPTYVADFVSIAVAGPTYVSGEMILPQSFASKPGQPPAPPAGYNPTVTPISAWNCLLANNYGVTSTYLNSERAFIEEWAEAIDMFGGVFSGITLTVSTGNGLLHFPPGSGGSQPGCGLAVSAPSPNSPPPPPAFKADCAVSPRPLFPADCAAEAAILAYFAEPPVGGPNAKATEEDALAASDDVVPTLLTLSNASVKWLAQITSGGLAAVAGNPASPGSMPVMSRMLGGVQFVGFASSGGAASVGCPVGACPGCLIRGFCTLVTPGSCLPANTCTPAPPWTCGPLPCYPLSSTNAPVEQALLNVLQVYFAGTSKYSVFAAPKTQMNTTAPVVDAPMNYLQVWFPDIEYAAGFGNCPREVLMAYTPMSVMSNAATLCSSAKTETGATPLTPYMYTAPASMPTISLGGSSYNAQGLLKLAGANIPTKKPVASPLFGYNNGKNSPCTCSGTDVPRDAFPGDYVCVTQTQQTDAIASTAAAQSSTGNHYLPPPETIYTTNPTDTVPYGICEKGYGWRQAHMGDYVCVSTTTMPPVPTQVGLDNAARRITCPK